ncbi:hypothetical protein FGO68_gene17512 [Halteria grandinella]|uniref:Uncharacterized protein n=1 Tax=Halteria grandinella TaxID=5974 RepID=A0A8J8NAT8_HALGN|nr:hypothetical protein FGO68_gene17512 [Halteria grandinella]
MRESKQVPNYYLRACYTAGSLSVFIPSTQGQKRIRSPSYFLLISTFQIISLFSGLLILFQFLKCIISEQSFAAIQEQHQLYNCLYKKLIQMTDMITEANQSVFMTDMIMRI